jgi:hypothetical protein
MISTINPISPDPLFESGYSYMASLQSYSLTQIFINTVGAACSNLFNVFLMFLAITNMYGLIISHSRITYGFSRDNALPYSSWLNTVDPIHKVPIRATWVTIAIDCIIMLPALYSNTLFAAINSFGVIGIQMAYFIPILLRTIRFDTFPSGPFTLGSLGLPFGIISSLYLLLVSIILTLPTQYTDITTYQTMDPATNATITDTGAYQAALLANTNWAPVMVTIVGVSIIASWVFSARHWFTGPPINNQYDNALSPHFDLKK